MRVTNCGRRSPHCPASSRRCKDRRETTTPHETASWEVSPSGPTDRWPTRSGFDKFYGFIGGEANQWAPAIYDGMNQVEPPKQPNYHFLTDMTDKAIDWTQVWVPARPGMASLAGTARLGYWHRGADWD